MRKIFLRTVLMMAVVVTGISCSSSKHSKSKRLSGVWQAQPITIDGSNKDWPSPYPEYDDKAYIGYAVSNDKENLYITVETGDPATQLKILRQGLTVWIDRAGGKEEVTAINFPIPTSGGAKEERKRQAGQQGQQGTGGTQSDKRRMELEDKVDKALADAIEYSLQGFKSCNLQFPIMVMDSCGIKTRIAMDTDRELVWEAVVPFKSFYYKGLIARSDRGKPLSISIETTGEKKPAGQGSGNHGGSGGGGGMRPSFGMGGMGMGMRMGGGGGGGHNRSQQNPDNSMMEPLYKSTKTYKKFGIAYQE